MPATPEPQDHRTARRRHPASRARVAAALLSMGGFLGAAFGMAATHSTLAAPQGAGQSGTTSSGTAASSIGATPAGASAGTKVVTTTHGS